MRFHRQRTPGARGYEVDWIDLASGQRRALDYDASGKLMPGRPLPDYMASAGGWNPSGACGCDLDPFIDFPQQAQLRVSLLGDQTIDGRATLHLRFTVTGGVQPSTTQFWIDRITYLPVRSKVVYGGNLVDGQRTSIKSTTDQFSWLPRTSANLAHLNVATAHPGPG